MKVSFGFLIKKLLKKNGIIDLILVRRTKQKIKMKINIKAFEELTLGEIKEIHKKYLEQNKDVIEVEELLEGLSKQKIVLDNENK